MSDWSSDVCSSDLDLAVRRQDQPLAIGNGAVDGVGPRGTGPDGGNRQNSGGSSNKCATSDHDFSPYDRPTGCAVGPHRRPRALRKDGMTTADPKSVVTGTIGSVREDLGGRP